MRSREIVLVECLRSYNALPRTGSIPHQLAISYFIGFAIRVDDQLRRLSGFFWPSFGVLRSLFVRHVASPVLIAKQLLLENVPLGCKALTGIWASEFTLWDAGQGRF